MNFLIPIRNTHQSLPCRGLRGGGTPGWPLLPLWSNSPSGGRASARTEGGNKRICCIAPSVSKLTAPPSLRTGEPLTGSRRYSYENGPVRRQGRYINIYKHQRAEGFPQNNRLGSATFRQIGIYSTEISLLKKRKSSAR